MMTIRSGSNANCVYIQNGSYGILVDVGAGIRTVEKALAEVGRSPHEIAAIFITHEHSDHIAGLSALTKKYPIPIFANDATAEAICLRYPELDPDLFVSLPTGRSAVCPDLEVSSFKTSHDAAESVGFTLGCGGKHVSVMTDIGRFDERLLSCAAGSDLVLLEANHDVDMLKVGPYPYPLKRRILSDHGHLSNDDCASALIKLYQTGVHRAILGHLSGENNMEALALETVRQGLRRADIPDGDFALDVAHRGEIGKMYEI